jgi:hypothetical protein
LIGKQKVVWIPKLKEYDEEVAGNALILHIYIIKIEYKNQNTPYNILTLICSSNTPPQAGAYILLYKPSLKQINSNFFQHKDFVNILASSSLDFTNGVDISLMSILS